MGVENNIPEGWVETTLGDISSRKQYGYTESASNEKVGPKFLRITDIQNDFISWNKVPYCPISDEDFTKYKLQVGDVVIARTGNSTGATATIKDKINAVFASYLIRFQINKQIADYNFIDFLVRSKLWYGFVKSVKSGSAQGGANANDFALFPINLPLIPEQKSIAKVLTAFDDKIELLQAQNRTLETMAQTIFKEWFGKHQIGDELPEGWRFGKLGDILSNVKNPVKKDMTISDRVYIPIDQMPMKKLGLSAFRPIQEAKSSLILFEPGDILFGAMRSYFHRVNFSKIKGVTRTTAMVLRPKNNKFLGFSLMLMNQTSTVNFASITSKGSTMPYAVWNETLENMPIILPKEKIIIDYSEKVNFMLNKIQHNINQIQSLTKARDTLLPKLMSGQVRVNNIKQTADA